MTLDYCCKLNQTVAYISTAAVLPYVVSLQEQINMSSETQYVPPIWRWVICPIGKESKVRKDQKISKD